MAIINDLSGLRVTLGLALIRGLQDLSLVPFALLFERALLSLSALAL